MQTADIARHVTNLMPQWIGQDIEDVEYLPGGYSNDNFVFRYQHARYVLRIPQTPQVFIDRQHEQAWYASLPPGIGVKPLAMNSNNGTMLCPWVEGRLLIDAWPQLGVDDLVAYLRTLHQRLPDNDRDYDVTSICTAYWHDQAPPYTLDSQGQEHRHICHNDLNPWNILVTDQGWVTLDWEFVGNNDPLFDAVSLHQGLELPANELIDFAAAYLGEKPGKLSLRLQAAERAFWNRELGWAHYQLNNGNERDEIRTQEITAKQALKRLYA